MKILLACACGMSTSMLAQKMNKKIEEREFEGAVEADTVDNIEKIIQNYDVILLGPQVGYKKEEIEQIAKEYEVPVGVIDTMDYGKLDGVAVLDQAVELAN